MFRVQELKSEHAKRVEAELIQDLVKVVDADNPKNYCILPKVLTEGYLQDIKSMKVYDDDIWIITFPKCGTTWTQEMVWLMCNNLNFDQALQTDLDFRVPFLELEGISAKSDVKIPTFQIVSNSPRPRLIKTHLPVFLLPNEIWTVQPKIIYVARNPKDTAVSFFHHHVNLHGWPTANMDFFINAFVNDKMFYSPFNDHVLEYWNASKKLNILYLHFEDMKRNLREVLQEIASFLGKSFSTEEYDKLCEHLKFDSMQKNKAANKIDMIKMLDKVRGFESGFHFIRKGKVGSHKEELTLEQIEMLDSYVKQIDFDETDFRYKFQ